MTTTISSAPSPSQPITVGRALTTTLSLLPPAALLSALAWLVVGRISLMRLEGAVPLPPADLAQVSWLGSPGTAMHFFGMAIPALLLLMGAAIALARGSILPLLSAGVLSFILGFSGAEADAVRIGILDDVTKVGCYVDSAECRSMLGMDKGTAKSMYATPAERAQGKVFADWYLTARDAAAPAATGAGLASSMPGGWIVRAPLYWNSADELKQKLATQKEAMARFQAAH